MKLEGVKEISTVNLGPNDFLVIKMDDTEHESVSFMYSLREQLEKFMDGKLKGRVMIVSGITITKVSGEDDTVS